MLVEDPVFRRQRRGLLMASPRLTGVDWVELADADAARLRLKVHFVPSHHPGKAAIPAGIAPSDILVTSEAGAGIPAASVHYPAEGGTALAVDLDAGLDALGGEESGFAFLQIHNLDSVDQLFSRATFSLEKGERAAIDPLRPAHHPEAPRPSRGIDYLAKDFQSFRRLMLDHMAAQAPDWRERHPADIGIVLVEILAYAADYLSYYQDAVATEAYLSTARRRISVRRHARMLDYRTYENCAARVWLQVEVNSDGKLKRGFRAFCDHPGPFPNRRESTSSVPTPGSGQPVFETIEDADLLQEHNCLPLYNWGVRGFRIPAGATSAMLDGDFTRLNAGDVLIFAPYPDPVTRRSPGLHAASGHAVRLVRRARVTRDPLADASRKITEIVWHDGDGLPFDMPVADVNASGQTHDEFAAWGNIVAADAGVTVRPDTLTLAQDRRGRFSAALHFPDIVYSVPYDRRREQPAAAFMRFDPRDGVPAIRLESVTEGAQPADVWNERSDFLDSDRFASDFVAETDDSGVTTLRFGDGVHGMQPAPGTQFCAVYRIGGGDNDVGAYSIRSWEPRLEDNFIAGVTNPLAAGGGASRQPIREVRRDAPQSFRNLLHCATGEDFVSAVKADTRVQCAVAQNRWIGSRHTICVYVQRAGGLETDRAFLAELEAELNQRRILGSDVALLFPDYVPLRISLTVTVQPSHARNIVRRNVAEAIEELYRFGRLSFGEPVYLRTLIARAADVPGVDNVTVEEFHRFGSPPHGEIEAGLIAIGPSEIAQLDNRPDTANRGRLTVNAITVAPVEQP
jgi:hypothetical protein